jgi:two-component system cell cycle response regulator
MGSTVFKFLAGPDVEDQYREEVYRMTIVDGLTEVYVLRYLLEALDKAWMRAQRHGSALALLTIELDAIEGAGALPGAAADRVLREFAGVLRRSVPCDAILARYRPERFAMLLPEQAFETACAFAESLREHIANSTLAVGQRALRPTAGIGVASRHDDDRTSADILQRADRALDLATSRGRNQVECTAGERDPTAGARKLV